MELIPSPVRDTFETVLVVDDNEMVLNTVVAILEHANYRVHSALNGKDALE